MPLNKIKLELDVNAINLVLNGLDRLPHKDVNEVFDYILQEANKQTAIKLSIPLDIEPAEERE